MLDKSEIITFFKRIYPEDTISEIKIDPVDEIHYILTADFSDRNYYFVVEDKAYRSISPSFDTLEDARRSI